MRSYASDEARPGTSFIFGALKQSPGFWDSNYEVGMVPHGGVIALTQFLNSLRNKAPNIEAVIKAAKSKPKRTRARTSASGSVKARKTQKPWRKYRKAAVDARLRKLRKTHGYA